MTTGGIAAVVALSIGCSFKAATRAIDAGSVPTSPPAATEQVAPRAEPFHMTAGFGSLWLSAAFPPPLDADRRTSPVGDRKIVRFDPVSGQAIGAWPLDVEHLPTLVAGDGAMYGLAADLSVHPARHTAWRLDPATHEMTRQVWEQPDPPDRGQPCAPDGHAATAAGLWVTSVVTADQGGVQGALMLLDADTLQLRTVKTEPCLDLFGTYDGNVVAVQDVFANPGLRRVVELRDPQTLELLERLPSLPGRIVTGRARGATLAVRLFPPDGETVAVFEDGRWDVTDVSGLVELSDVRDGYTAVVVEPNHPGNSSPPQQETGGSVRVRPPGGRFQPVAGLDAVVPVAGPVIADGAIHVWHHAPPGSSGSASSGLRRALLP